MMQSPKTHQGDAFERALNEAFGELASPDRVKQARELYARHRTDDILKRLRGTTPDVNDGGDNP
jgi:hypothetical protein